ncbi:ATP-binding protein [Flavobacterium sp. LHD-85]|uniref:ATP-binding protein n=1 Tax=Flavobacterium sp. LHD-85 TaxID=3071410 RepID=UPI0027E1AEE2|nr:ATP-binding protein [Flavobacterium sp. LHD-85]MDQ6531860.1 ATP-binding protein [Flavobacterium sp. LHD-85]
MQTTFPFILFYKLKMFLLFFGIIFLMHACETKTTQKIRQKKYSAEIEKFVAKADTFYDHNKIDSSLLYYNKALALSNPDVDHVQYVYILSSIADILTIDSDYATSEELLTRTLPYLSKIKEPIYARNVYSYMAYNYYNTYDFENALLYHKKALKQPATSYKKAVILNDIATVFIAQKKYKTAVEILKPLTSEKIIFKKWPRYSNQFHADVLLNLGYCYFKLKQPNAIKYYEESLKIGIKVNNEYSLDYTYRLLSEFHQESNPKLALIYAKKSYEQAFLVKSARNRANSLAQLIRTSEGNELKKYSHDYIKIIDSITEGRRRAKNQFSNMKYLSKKDKDENLQLKTDKIENELQLERERNRNFILYVIIAFSLTTLLFLFYYLISKGRREKIDAVYTSEAQIARKLHTELSYDIYETLSFAKENNLGYDNKEKFLSHLNNIYSKTRNLSRENSEILTDENFEKVLKEMISGYSSSKLNIITNGLSTFSWSKIDRAKKITVFRVIQEIFNQVKTRNNFSLASITFKMDEEEIIITYADNSSEIHDQNNLNERFANIENRLKLIKGTFNVSLNQSQGFKVLIKFPL